MPFLEILLACLFSLGLLPARMADIFGRLLNNGRKRRASSDSSLRNIAANLDRASQENCKLLQLPDEILVSVIVYLDIRDLLSTRLASFHLDELAQPFVFESFDIISGTRSERLDRLIRNDSRRAKWIKSVLVSTRHEEDRGLEKFPVRLCQMSNLRNLILETPDCNARLPSDRIKWIRLQKDYEKIFEQSSVAIPFEKRVLPSLEKCTLHFVDDYVSLYPLTKYSSIFLHPTLQILTISCMSTDRPSTILRSFRQYERSTGLKRLHLEECDFDPESLAILLRFPIALKSLTMSEGIRYSDELTNRPSRLHGNLNPGALSSCLSRSVAESLEHLSVSLGYHRRRGQGLHSPSNCLNFTSLSQLRRLDISMSSLGLVITRPSCDHALYQRLPPSIEHIRVFSIPLLIIRGRPPVPFQPCLFTNKVAHGLPNLKQVTCCYEYQSLRGNPPFGIFHRGGGEDTLSRISEACKRRVINKNNRLYPIYNRAGIRVVTEIEVTPPGFIPPYLHLEEKPVRDSVWDSHQPTYEALTYEARLEEQLKQQSSQTNPGAPPNVVTQNGEEDDEHDFPLMNLPPQAAELFEMLITGLQPLQPADDH